MKTAAFIREVVPAGTLCIAQPNGKYLRHRAFSDYAELAAYALADNNDKDTYFAVGTLIDRTRQSKTGKPYVPRDYSNIAKLRSFVVDIDFKQHESKDAAVAAIKDFLQSRKDGFPPPSIIVNSGYGFHLYWVVDRDLDRDDWKVVASAFADYLRINGRALNADLQVTVDAARIMRLPGTYNRKHGGSVECRVVGHTGRRIDYDKFVRIVSEGSNDSAGLLELREQFRKNNVVELFPVEDNNDLGNIDAALGKREFNLGPILKECATYRALAVDRGATQNYPYWITTLNLFPFLQDGEKWAHKFSEGHKDYDPKETKTRFTESLEKIEAGKLGPPRCSTIARHSSHCQTCPHLGNLASPLLLGDVTKHTGGPDPTWVKQGATYMLHTAEGEQPKMIEVYPAELDNWRLVKNLDGVYSLAFEMRNGQTIADIVVPTVEISASTPPPTASQFGMVLSATNWKRVQKAMHAWIHKLQHQGQVEQSSGFGWSKDAFSIATEAYYENGRVGVLGTVDKVYKQIYAFSGTEAKSFDALRVLKEETRAAPHIMVAAAFGAVIAEFMPDRPAGLFFSSPESGPGKSTYMALSQGIWGDPRLGIAKGTDTTNALRTALSVATDLPFFIDEVRGNEQVEKVRELVFDAIQGQEKRRLDSRARARHAAIIRRLIIMGSNSSLETFIGELTGEDVDASQKRLLEVNFPVKPQELKSKDELWSRASQTVRRNYGLIGRAYAKYLAKEQDSIAKASQSTRERLRKAFSFNETERFWASAVTCVVMGAQLGNKMGVPIDIEKVERGLQRVIQNARSEAVELQERKTPAADIVHTFRDYVLIRMQDGSIVASLKSPGIYIDYVNDVLYLPTRIVSDYCGKRGLASSRIKKELKKLAHPDGVPKKSTQLPGGLGKQYAWKLKANLAVGSLKVTS